MAKPSIDARINVSMIVMPEPCWMNPIIDFLATDRLPVDERKVDRVRRMVAWYWLSAYHKLYRWSFGGPYLQCLHPSKVEELLTELHEGVCGSHVGGTYVGPPSNHPRILVATNAQRCREVCSKM